MAQAPKKQPSPTNSQPSTSDQLPNTSSRLEHDFLEQLNVIRKKCDDCTASYIAVSKTIEAEPAKHGDIFEKYRKRVKMLADYLENFKPPLSDNSLLLQRGFNEIHELGRKVRAVYEANEVHIQLASTRHTDNGNTAGLMVNDKTRTDKTEQINEESEKVNPASKTATFSANVTNPKTPSVNPNSTHTKPKTSFDVSVKVEGRTDAESKSTCNKCDAKAKQRSSSLPITVEVGTNSLCSFLTTKHLKKKFSVTPNLKKTYAKSESTNTKASYEIDVAIKFENPRSKSTSTQTEVDINPKQTEAADDTDIVGCSGAFDQSFSDPALNNGTKSNSINTKTKFDITENDNLSCSTIRDSRLSASALDLDKTGTKFKCNKTHNNKTNCDAVTTNNGGYSAIEQTLPGLPVENLEQKSTVHKATNSPADLKPKQNKASCDVAVNTQSVHRLPVVEQTLSVPSLNLEKCDTKSKTKASKGTINNKLSFSPTQTPRRSVGDLAELKPKQHNTDSEVGVETNYLNLQERGTRSKSLRTLRISVRALADLKPKQVKACSEVALDTNSCSPVDEVYSVPSSNTEQNGTKAKITKAKASCDVASDIHKLSCVPTGKTDLKPNPNKVSNEVAGTNSVSCSSVVDEVLSVPSSNVVKNGTKPKMTKAKASGDVGYDINEVPCLTTRISRFTVCPVADFKPKQNKTSSKVAVDSNTISHSSIVDQKLSMASNAAKNGIKPKTTKAKASCDVASDINKLSCLPTRTLRFSVHPVADLKPKQNKASSEVKVDTNSVCCSPVMDQSLPVPSNTKKNGTKPKITKAKASCDVASDIHKLRYVPTGKTDLKPKPNKVSCEVAGTNSVSCSSLDEIHSVLSSNTEKNGTKAKITKAKTSCDVASDIHKLSCVPTGKTNLKPTPNKFSNDVAGTNSASCSSVVDEVLSVPSSNAVKNGTKRKMTKAKASGDVGHDINEVTCLATRISRFTVCPVADFKPKQNKTSSKVAVDTNTISHSSIIDQKLFVPSNAAKNGIKPKTTKAKASCDVASDINKLSCLPTRTSRFSVHPVADLKPKQNKASSEVKVDTNSVCCSPVMEQILPVPSNTKKNGTKPKITKAKASCDVASDINTLTWVPVGTSRFFTRPVTDLKAKENKASSEVAVDTSGAGCSPTVDQRLSVASLNINKGGAGCSTTVDQRLSVASLNINKGGTKPKSTKTKASCEIAVDNVPCSPANLAVRPLSDLQPKQNRPCSEFGVVNNYVNYSSEVDGRLSAIRLNLEKSLSKYKINMAKANATESSYSPAQINFEKHCTHLAPSLEKTRTKPKFPKIKVNLAQAREEIKVNQTGTIDDPISIPTSQKDVIVDEVPILKSDANASTSWFGAKPKVKETVAKPKNSSSNTRTRVKFRRLTRLERRELNILNHGPSCLCCRYVYKLMIDARKQTVELPINDDLTLEPKVLSMTASNVMFPYLAQHLQNCKQEEKNSESKTDKSLMNEENSLFGDERINASVFSNESYVEESNCKICEDFQVEPDILDEDSIEPGEREKFYDKNPQIEQDILDEEDGNIHGGIDKYVGLIDILDEEDDYVHGGREKYDGESFEVEQAILDAVEEVIEQSITAIPKDLKVMQRIESEDIRMSVSENSKSISPSMTIPTCTHTKDLPKGIDICPFCDYDTATNRDLIVIPDFCKMNFHQTTCEFKPAPQLKRKTKIKCNGPNVNNVDKENKTSNKAANPKTDSKVNVGNENKGSNAGNKLTSSSQNFASIFNINLTHVGNKRNRYIRNSWLLPQSPLVANMTDNETERKTESLRKSSIHTEDWEKVFCKRVSQQLPEKSNKKKRKLYSLSSWIESEQYYMLCKPNF